MSPAWSAEQPGRYLLAAGTGSYDSGERLPGVETDLDLMTGLFQELGYQAERLLDPDLAGLKRRIGDWVGSPGRGLDDLLVLYYAGHGAVTVGDRRHYLLARDSDSEKPAATALATEDLLRLLHEARPGRGTGRVFLILDTCYSGWGAGDLSGVATELSRTDGAGFYVLVCARPKQEALDGVFAAAFAEAVRDERFGGARQPLIQLEELVHGINRRFEESGCSQRAAYDVYQGSELFPFLPNPRFRAGLPPGIDLESQGRLLQEDLEVHWSPKARGVEIEAREGWYFTGRTAVLRRLVAWLGSPDRDGRVRVVTGRPGSGKSAVLGRLVTCSAGAPPGALEGAGEGTLPPEGIIDLPIHARGRTVAEIAGIIATGAGLEVEGPQRLVGALAARGRELVVVVDALDEAAEPERIADLLRETASYAPTVRVLVGTRPTLVARFGDDATVLDLDGDDLFDERDVEGYARRRLLEERGSPYRRRPARAREAARAVAARAGRSFLLAQVLTRSLVAAKKAARTESARWRASLSSDLRQAFERDLRRFGAETRRVCDLLRPLAWAEGRGLPWADLWAPLASKIAGKRYGDGDLRWLRDHAGAYIVEDQDAGQSVYRLFHREFARFLRRRRREVKAQERIVKALEGTVPRSSAGRLLWPEAHSYVRTHLATHAARCGRLEELIEDPLFLAAADPVRLLSVLPDEAAGAAGEAARLFKLAFHHLRRARSAGESASYLQLAARQDRKPRWAKRIQKLPVDRLWSVPWAKWMPGAAHRVLIGHRLKIWPGSIRDRRRDAKKVHAVAVGKVGDDPVVVSAGQDGTIRLWGATTGFPRAEPLRGHRGGVTCLAIGRLNGRPIIVSGGEDKTVRTWEMTTGMTRGAPLRGHRDEVSALAIAAAGGRPVVLSGSWDKSVRVWDLATGEPLGVLHRGDEWICELAAADSGERPLAAALDGEERLWVWDLETMAPAAGIAWSPGDKATALGVLDGRLVITRGRQVLDVTSGRQVGLPGVRKGRGAAWGRVEDRPIMVSRGGGLEIRVWSLETGKAEGPPVGGRADGSQRFSAVALGEIGGRPAIVSGGIDGVVRIWDLPRPGTRRRGPRKPRQALGGRFAFATREGRTLLVSRSDPTHLGIWDLATGRLLERPILLNKRDEIWGLEVAEVNGVPAVALGDYCGGVYAWHLDGEMVSEMQLGSELTAPLVSMALGWVGGYPVLIAGSAGAFGDVWVRDLIRRPDGIEADLAVGIEGAAHAVAVGEVEGRAGAFASDGEIIHWWDLTGRRPKERLLGGHRSTIRSLAFAHLAGRPVLLSGDEAGDVRLWSFSGGRARVRRVLKAHRDWVLTLAIGELRGEPRIVSGGWDGRLCVWRPDGGLEWALELLSGVLNAEIAPRSRLCVSTKAGFLVLDFEA